MTVRTTPALVAGIITTDLSIDISPFIDVANALTDYVLTQDTASVLNTQLLRQIETWLAAHYYAVKDQQYSEKKTGDASAKFQVGEAGTGAFQGSEWGRNAMALDISGTLRKLNKGVVTVGLECLGKPPSTQIDYLDRD